MMKSLLILIAVLVAFTAGPGLAFTCEDRETMRSYRDSMTSDERDAMKAEWSGLSREERQERFTAILAGGTTTSDDDVEFGKYGMTAEQEAAFLVLKRSGASLAVREAYKKDIYENHMTADQQEQFMITSKDRHPEWWNGDTRIWQF